MPRWVRDACLSALIASVLVPAGEAQYVQQGIPLVGSGGSGFEGSAVALSADGNTALVGAWADGFGLRSPPTGATWVFTRGGSGVWTQQGGKLGGDLSGPRSAQGSSVGLSADGNTAIVGGPVNNLPCFFPAPPSGGAWIYARSGGVWNQPGTQLTAAGPVTGAVAISGDGTTVIVGGFDSTVAGAAWIFTRVNGVWTQQGNELVGEGALGQRGSSCEGLPTQVGAVALSADGNTAVVGAPADSSYAGAVWIFNRTGGTWSQQGGKLVGSGAAGAAGQGISVALSGDGNTAVVGGPGDSRGAGAVWVFTRTREAWSQQGQKFVSGGAAGLAGFGGAVAISGDGATAIVGGSRDNNNTGAAWTFTRANGVWSQQGSKFIGAPAENASSQGAAVAISADAGTVLVGGPLVSAGAAWAFTASPSAGTPAATGVAPAAGSGAAGTFTFTFSHSAGWQNLTVLDVLINNALDGRRSCYLAFLPTDAGSGKLYLVDDAGHAEGPYSAMTLPGAGSVQNSQCIVTGAGSLVSATGNTLTLALAITFTSAFAGNQVFYVAARDPSATSGWQALGTWSVPGTPIAGPSVVGMSPARVSGASQTYTFTLTDGNGWQDISVVNILVNSAIDGRRACYLAFVPSSMSGGSLFLVNDAGDAAGPYSTLTLPGSGAVNNSQCAVAAAGSSVSGNSNTLTLTLPLAFSHSFAGNLIFYLAARNNTLNSGWQAAGTLTVP